VDATCPSCKIGALRGVSNYMRCSRKVCGQIYVRVGNGVVPFDVFNKKKSAPVAASTDKNNRA